MRIACRISLTPAELNRIFAALVSRLEDAGVSRVPGFNLYINPWASGGEMQLRNERDEAVDIFAVDDTTPELLMPSNSMYRLMLPWDYDLRRTFLWFVALVEMSGQAERDLLGATSSLRWQQLMAPLMPELTAAERYGMQTVETVAHRLAQLCGGHQEVAKWLFGPFPAKGLVGDTPAEQLRIGGLASFEYMGKALGRYIREFWRDGFRVDPPPLGFDSYPEVSTSSEPVSDNQMGKAKSRTRQPHRRRPI